MVAQLQDAADIRSKEIVIVMRRDHLRPDGTKFATAIDPSFRSSHICTENCAQGEGLFAPDAAVRTWMNSPGHKANMLDKAHCYFGCGIHKANSKGYWVQMFAGGGGVVDAWTDTGSFNFESLAEMEKSYLICGLSDGSVAYVPLDEEYMVRNGQSYTLHLRGKSVTVNVAKPIPEN
jgi:hypothetical protein